MAFSNPLHKFRPTCERGVFRGKHYASSTFDVYLGRLAASGSVFNPMLKYLLQIQGSTAGNGNGITLLDWFSSKTLSKFLTLQAAAPGCRSLTSFMSIPETFCCRICHPQSMRSACRIALACEHMGRRANRPMLRGTLKRAREKGPA